MLRSKKFEKVAIGPVHTFAVSNTNDLYAWGTGFLDEKSHSKEPVAIAPGLKVKSVAAGPKHNAVIGLDGQVYTWGHGGSWMSGGGQLGEFHALSRSQFQVLRMLMHCSFSSFFRSWQYWKRRSAQVMQIWLINLRS